jgi:hypothetical protein
MTINSLLSLDCIWWSIKLNNRTFCFCQPNEHFVSDGTIENNDVSDGQLLYIKVTVINTQVIAKYILY